MLYRALRFATVIGVVEQNDSQYSLTETGALLLKDVPGSVYMGILLIGSEPWQHGWENFAHSLATGNAAFDQAMGEPFFDYLDKHPEYDAPFNQWQNILTSMTARAITEVYDFTSFGTICDVGGGQGILLKSILSANSDLRGILYDQESVVKDHVLADLSRHRVEIQSGDFFEHVPHGRSADHEERASRLERRDMSSHPKPLPSKLCNPLRACSSLRWSSIRQRI